MGIVALGTIGLVSALGSSASVLKDAIAKTKAAEHGTNHVPDTTKRTVAKGKKIFVISAFQALESNKIPSNAAVEAAHAIGWQAPSPLDGGNLQSKFPGLIRQAVSQGAQGIILDAIDCQYAKAPLDQARKKGIVIVPIYAFDCNDPSSSTHSAADFASCVNYSLPCAHTQNFTKSYGADQANYIIAKTKNKAKILQINDPEFLVLKYTGQGFADTIARSGGSKVVATLNFKSSQIATGKLKQLVQNALLKHPEVNWVKSPYAAATTFGSIAAVAHAAGKNVMGGEGFTDEQNLIKAGTITAVNVINSAETGWAAIDAMNSVFTHKPSHPSGIGWTILDKQNSHVQNINYVAAYKKAWGK